MKTSRFHALSCACALFCAAFSSCSEEKLIINGSITVSEPQAAEGASVNDGDVTFEYAGGENSCP